MKKALALVLAVVMMAGLAISANAAQLVTEKLAVQSLVAVNGQASGVYSANHGDIVAITLRVENETSGVVSSKDNFTAKATVKDGKAYAKDFECKDGIITFIADNTTSSSKTIKIEVTLTAIAPNTLHGEAKQTLEFTVNQKDADAETFNLDDIDGADYLFPDLAINTDDFGYLSTAIFNAMKADSDNEIVVTSGDYELTFDKNSGSANGKIDIDGSTTVSDAVKNKNSSVASNLMLAINLDSNSAVAKFVLTGSTQDFRDAADSNTLYVYDANGKLTSYTAKINDDDNVEFTAPIGSYIVSPAKLSAVSGSGSTGSQKPIPGTGR